MNVVDSSGHASTVGAVRETQQVSLNGRLSESEMSMSEFPGGPIKPWLKSTCIKDNSWFPDASCQPGNLVVSSSWTGFTVFNRSSFYHADDDLYWWKYERKFWSRDHRNPSTPDGVWLAPEGYGYVASANFNCDKGFPSTERCRFN
jgi:hypothetical protein